MKKSLFYLLAGFVLLAVFVSCNGGIDEDVFDKNIHKYELQLDGSWQCMRDGCYSCIEGTNKPYIALLEDGKLVETSIISLTSDMSETLGTGTVSVSSDAITYSNVEDSSEAQEVIIRTGSNQTLTVKGKIGSSAATSDEIHHYGYAAEISLSVADFCFYTHARVKKMDITCGKAIADENGFVELVTAEEGSEVEEKNGGIFIIPVDTSEDDITDPIITELGYTTESGKIVIDTNSSKGKEKAEAVANQKEYKIETVADLIELREKYNAGVFYSESISLKNDLDLTGVDWIPIGTWEYPFHGVFKGNGKTIKGLTLTEDASNQIYSYGKTIDHDGEIFGFFGIVGDGAVTISDVTFKDVNICSDTAHNVGTVIAYSPISSNFFEADKGAEYAPGKWDGNENVGKTNISITNVSVSGKIDVYSHAGGFIGKLYAESSATFTGCTNDMDITTHNQGGLAGYVGYAKSPISLVLDSCTYTDKAKLSFDNSDDEETCSLYIGDYCAGTVNATLQGTCTTNPIAVNINTGSKLYYFHPRFANETTIEGLTIPRFYNYGNIVLKNSKVTEYIKNYASSNLTVDSCTFAEFFNYGTATLKNSEAIDENNTESSCPIYYCSKSNTIIESGTYKKISARGTIETSTKFEIKGGEFSSTIAKDTNCTMTISGGKFYYSSLTDTAKKKLKYLLDNCAIYTNNETDQCFEVSGSKSPN